MENVVEVVTYSNVLTGNNAEESEIASFILLVTMRIMT